MSVSPVPQHGPATPEQRRATLEQAVQDHVREGFRVETITDSQAVVVKGRRPNHLLHFFLSLFTLGFWALFVWLPIGVFGGERRRVLTVTGPGQVNVRKGRG